MTLPATIRRTTILVMLLAAPACGNGASDIIETPPIAIPHRAIVTGRVLSSTGLPILGARVLPDLPVTRGSFVVAFVASAADGSFRLEVGRLGAAVVGVPDTVSGTVLIDYGPQRADGTLPQYRVPVTFRFFPTAGTPDSVTLEYRLPNP